MEKRLIRLTSGEFLGGHFGYFLFFLLRGGKLRIPGRQGGGGVFGFFFLLKIPEGGGLPGEGGREGVCWESGAGG